MKNKLTFFRVRAHCVCGVTSRDGVGEGWQTCTRSCMREPHSQAHTARPSEIYDEYAYAGGFMGASLPTKYDGIDDYFLRLIMIRRRMKTIADTHTLDEYCFVIINGINYNYALRYL